MVKLSSNSTSSELKADSNNGNNNKSDDNNSSVYNDLLSHRDVICLPQLRFAAAVPVHEYDVIVLAAAYV